MAARKKQSAEVSEDTRILVVVLCLLFFYPAGLILTWVWTDWPKWLKILLTVPVIFIILWLFFIFFIFFMVAFTASNSSSIPFPTAPISAYPTLAY